MINKKDNLENEFLPAALEITETPPSPSGKLIIWIVFAIFFATILWSYLGTVDEVAVARGKLIPDGRLKVIQPVEEGVVKAIYVKEGQRVKKGDLLIELDETMKKVDVDGLKNRLAVAKIEKEVLKAELEGRSTESVLAKLKKENSSLSADDIRYINELKSAKETEYTEKAETLKVVITQRESEHQMAVTNQTRLEQKVKDLTEENESLKYLYGLGSIAKRKWKDKEQELYSTQKEYEAQQAAVIQAKDKIEEAKRNLASIEKEKNTGILNLIVEKEKLINETESSLSKAEKSYEFQRVVSPVDGTINGLSAHTIGGIVTPSQPILTIVPDDTPIIVEANVTNQDIGFIRVGQEVEIKMDTFPFQKYGTIDGKVVSISPDAFEDEKIGLVYKIKVEIKKREIRVNGKNVKLTTGMSLSAEVKTGKRTIMEFFLSPVLVSLDESLKLR